MSKLTKLIIIYLATLLVVMTITFMVIVVTNASQEMTAALITTSLVSTAISFTIIGVIWIEQDNEY